MTTTRRTADHSTLPRWRERATLSCVVMIILALFVGTSAAGAAVSGMTAAAVTADGSGYVAVDANGNVHTYGVTNFGQPRDFGGAIVGIALTADGRGYVAVSSQGQVYAYGSVRYRGNPSRFSGSIAGISVTADGQGYAAISTTGQVYAFGTVVYRGNPSGFSGSIVGVSVTADGQGYAAISTTGQVYAYGTVVYRGNPTNFGGAIAGIAVTGNGQGYVATSSTAQVYCYGSTRSHGNPYDYFGSARTIAVTADGQGYLVGTSAGQLHTYGTVAYHGDFGDVDVQNSTQHLRAARYVDWATTSSIGSYNVDQNLNVVVRADHTYWSMNWSWADPSASSGGYLGLQTDGNRTDGTVGDTAIFSIWNANGSRNGRCAAFGGEGSGVSCRVAYTVYGDGSAYRLRLWRLDSDSQGQWWGVWIRDSRRGDTEIGEIRAPSGAVHIGSANDFVEYFGPRRSCDTVPYSQVSWATPTFLGETGDASGRLSSSLKASCTGGAGSWITLADGTRAWRTTLGGARPGA